MVLGLIKSTISSQNIQLNRHTLILRKKSLLKTKEIQFSTRDIKTICLNNIKLTAFNSFDNIGGANTLGKQTHTPTPSIISNLKTETFFEVANTETQEWVTLYLNEIVQKMK